MHARVVLEILRFYRAHGGMPPQFVVLDGDTMLEIKTEPFFADAPLDYDGDVQICGVRVVVIPTDGLPMCRAVAGPIREATRQRIPERSEAD